MAHICCSPPESVPDELKAPLREAREKVEHPLDVVAIAAGSSFRRKAPSFRFSRTVSSEKSRRPSGTCTMPSATRFCVGRWSMRLPSNQISPPRSGTRPQTVLSVVVFPAPLEPMSVRVDSRPRV
jgi:hypothetical protein